MDLENSLISDGGSDAGSFEIVQERVDSNEAADFCESCEKYAQTCEERNAVIEALQIQTREKDEKIDRLSNDANDVSLEHIDLIRKNQLLALHIAGLDNHIQVLEKNYTALQEEHRLEGEILEKKSILIKALTTAATHNQSQIEILEIGIEERDKEIIALKIRNLKLKEQLCKHDEEAQQSKKYALQIQDDVRQIEQNVYSLEEAAHNLKLSHQDKVAKLGGTILKREAEIKAMKEGTAWRDEVIRALWMKVDVAESKLKDKCRQHKEEVRRSRQNIDDLRTDILLYEAGIVDLRNEIRRIDINSWMDLVRRQAQLINSLAEEEANWAGDLQNLRQEVVALREELDEERLQHEQITALRQVIEQGAGKEAKLNSLERDLEQRDARISQQDEQIAALRHVMETGSERGSELIQILNANADIIDALIDRIIKMEGAKGPKPTSQDPAPQSTTSEGSRPPSPTLQSSTNQDLNEMASLNDDDSDDEPVFPTRNRPIALSAPPNSQSEQAMSRGTAATSGFKQDVQMAQASNAGQATQMTQSVADTASVHIQGPQAPQHAGVADRFIVTRTSTQAQMLQNSSTYEEYYAYVAERTRLSSEYDQLMLEQQGERLI